MKTERAMENRENLLEMTASESGLAIVVVDEKSSVAKANNNSMCEHLYSSGEFAPLCMRDCGRAFQRATDAGKSVSYQCHAGLDCLAVPLKAEKPLVAIVGRTFTRAENYRIATMRAIEGDWSKFPSSRFFENVLISGSAANIETLAKRVEDLSEKILEAVLKTPPLTNGFTEPQETNEQPAAEQPATGDGQMTKPIEEFHQQEEQEISRKTNDDAEEITVWRSLFGSLFDLNYREARLLIIGFLSSRYNLSSLAWLERRENRFESVLATGTLEDREFKINLPANDRLLFDALEKEISLDLRERPKAKEKKRAQTISLFPVAVGHEIQSALVVADELTGDALKRRIAKFCKTVAAQLEILRLREEVKRRGWLTEAVEKFNASLRKLDADDFWMNLARISAELMHAERTSLLIFDEKKDLLTVKAAIGKRADRITNKSEKIGERVARIVLRNGRPVVVQDLAKLGFSPAPAERKYKTNSFISYPFTIGNRRVGILNVTDKADGEPYDEADLALLDAIAPQVAVLIDRADLKNKAGELEQLSLTDSLTKLLNRRYMEERLSEEIKRSNRYGYPMSLMMIDVDHFKSYNDAFGHIPGDNVLKMVAQCFRETLRGADVAARYGGEEFSILLPQTSVSEAESIADRVREHIELTEFPHRQITVSIGIAGCCLDLNSAQELFDAADKALYEAKRRGRNRVEVYENIGTGNGNQTSETPNHTDF
jgi:diguanylate cyclase (GGDEF)-like protein